MSNPTPPDGEDSISRRGIEVVIRRAIELSLAQQDASDHISEAELIKIAEELGLSPRHVRQALYERPATDEYEPGFLDRYFGANNVVTARAVPCDTTIAHGRLEDYLVTREYLQIRRRQGPNAFFEPADDAFSSLARAFRTSGRSHLARAQRAYLSVRPLEPGWCHVRLEMSYPDQRKSHVIYAAVFGTMAGGAAGLVVAAGVVLGVPGPPGTALAAVAALVTAGGTFAAVCAGIRNAYRRWLGKSRDEADEVLDRLEHGDDLRPPASPWLRRLQQRLRGFGSRPASG